MQLHQRLTLANKPDLNPNQTPPLSLSLSLLPGFNFYLGLQRRKRIPRKREDGAKLLAGFERDGFDLTRAFPNSCNEKFFILFRKSMMFSSHGQRCRVPLYNGVSGASRCVGCNTTESLFSRFNPAGFQNFRTEICG